MRRLLRALPTRFVREFMAMEAAGGIVMLAAAALAMGVANTPLAPLYQHLIHQPLVGAWNLVELSKDVLMVVFFFAVGMELKCEMREGTLSAKGQKLLPMVAALGGIVLPAALYLLLTGGADAYRAGWAIPTATDIAFALCVLRLIGPAVPQAAKIFLLAIAIYDDLAAILIIALFYSSGLVLAPLAAAMALVGLMGLLNHRQVSHVLPYLVLGIALWFALHMAGIHTTIAGVVTALFIPMRSRSETPVLAPLLHAVHPYVVLLILPLFAFTSAGVSLGNLSAGDVTGTLPVAIATSLFIGKQLGIFGATFAAVKLRLAPLPEGVSWHMVYGVAIIAGIGFTMSLFIGQLAFASGTEIDAVKLGVIGGSLLSALWGLLYLRLTRKHA